MPYPFRGRSRASCKRGNPAPLPLYSLGVRGSGFGLIKWPGGKGRILSLLRPLLPQEILRKHFVDPFVGGASSLLVLEPRGPITLGDAHPLLTRLYRGVADPRVGPRLRGLMEEMALFWDRMGDYLELEASPPFHAFRWKAPLPGPLARYRDLLEAQMERSLRAKALDLQERLARAYARQGRELGFVEARRHMETALRAGVYNFFRDALNRGLGNPLEETAFFYFTRELCFGAMFRRNAQGHFNVPYGGMSYNRKKLLPKVGRLFSPKTLSLLSRAEIFTADFRETLSRATEASFLFLDPPYLSEFSEYDGHPFALEDHQALRSYLKVFPGDFLLIVGGRTNPIFADLPHPKAYLISKYAYTVRNRNLREVEYLVVSSFPIPLEALSLRIRHRNAKSARMSGP